MLPLIFVLGGLAFGLYMALNIGANDVANAMATSVGSKALTLRQAVLAAAVFEFLGAVLVGGNVTKTVKKGIVDLEQLTDPAMFMAVMCCALLAAALWLHLATWRGWPVSTTHSIVGAVAGGGIAAAGLVGVHWNKLAFIGVSWVLSPIIGASIGYVLFRILSKRIINSPRPRVMVRRATPALAALVVFVLVLSLVYKGLKNLNLDFPPAQALLLAGGAAVAVGIVSLILIRRRPLPPVEPDTRFPYVELQFSWLQVITACYVAFAHGANDVANAIGPLAGILSTWRTGEVSGQVDVPIVLLAFGGAGIVVGLALWGTKVMETVGKRITELTPSRGFSAEFAAATTVLVCSKLGLPISTTHTLVGSVIGVGLARGMAALDMRVVRDILSAWVVTLPASFALSAILTLVVIGTLL
ncbi:MAG: inorganic phosphate transporter [Acidobacteriota bacterium]|nr:inorganic phosphate transporter [Acidobacteriota bacterium]